MSGVPFHARALFPYDAVEPTELSVAAGDEVIVEEVNESGWCLGKIGDRTGWLPTDYIEKVGEGGAAGGGMGGADGIETSRPQPEWDEQGNPIKQNANINMNGNVEDHQHQHDQHDHHQQQHQHQQPQEQVISNVSDAPSDALEMELVLEAEPEIESVQVQAVSRYNGPTPPQPSASSSTSSSTSTSTPRTHVKNDLYAEEEVSSSPSATAVSPIKVTVTPSQNHYNAIPTPPVPVANNNNNYNNSSSSPTPSAPLPHLPLSSISTQPLSSRPLPTPASTGPAPAAPHASSGKVCDSCKEPIRSAFVMAKDKVFHPQHFQCTICSKELGGKAYLERDDKFYCEDDYYSSFNPRCAQCNEIIKGPYISALDKTWHPDHFVCDVCHQPFPGNQFRKHEGRPLCETHFAELYAPKCAKCNKAIAGQVFEALDNKYHLECFTCQFNDHAIGEGVMFHIHEGKIYCPDHFEQMFLSRCSGCGQVIKGQYIKILEDHYHTECWKCSACQSVLRPESCGQDNGRFFCKNCITSGNLTPTLPAPLSFKKEVAATPTTTPASKPNVTTAAAAERKTPAVLDRPNSFGKSNANGNDSSSSSSLKTIDLSTLDGDSVLAQKLASLPKYDEPSASPSFPYEDLKTKNNERKPPSVDPAKREQYLSNEDFQKYFSMPKENFLKLPQWKRDAAKKAVDLF